MTSQGPLPPAGNVIKFVLQFTETGGLAYGSHFYIGYNGGPPSQTDMTALATQAFTSAGSGLMTQIPAGINLVGVTTTDLSSASGLVGIHSGSTAGTGGSTAVESGAATRLRFKIGTRYRGGHPGVFLPPGSTANVVEPASWAPSYQTAIASGWSSMISGILGTSVSSITLAGQVAVSYYHQSIANTDPSQWAPKNVPKLRETPVVSPVVGVSCAPLIGAQRRRRQATGA